MCDDLGIGVFGTLPLSETGEWQPERSGDYQKDTASGRRYADNVLGLVDDRANPLIFGAVVKAIVQGGVYDAVEIGFCSRIGMALAAA